AERIASRSVSYDAALEEIAAILHRVALAQAGAGQSGDEPDAERVAALASRLDAGQVQVMYQVAVLGRRDLPLAPDEFAGFSMAVLRMLSCTAASAPGASPRAPQADRAPSRPAAPPAQAAQRGAPPARPAAASP